MQQGERSGTAGAELKVVIERPPPGLARGMIAWPPWTIASAGGLVLAAGIVYLVLRHRRRRR